jgi:hypothetical protein
MPKELEHESRAAKNRNLVHNDMFAQPIRSCQWGQITTLKTRRVFSPGPLTLRIIAIDNLGLHRQPQRLGEPVE